MLSVIWHWQLSPTLHHHWRWQVCSGWCVCVAHVCVHACVVVVVGIIIFKCWSLAGRLNPAGGKGGGGRPPCHGNGVWRVMGLWAITGDEDQKMFFFCFFLLRFGLIVYEHWRRTTNSFVWQECTSSVHMFLYIFNVTACSLSNLHWSLWISFT